MSYKRVLLVILIISISALLVYSLIQMEESATQRTAESRPVALPYKWIGSITKEAYSRTLRYYLSSDSTKSIYR